MSGWIAPIRVFFGTLAFLLAVIVTAAWFFGAIWFQSAPAWRFLAVALPAAGALGLLALRYSVGHTAGWIGFALLLGAGTLWWSSIRPTNTADWAPDSAHGVTAEIGEGGVLVHNVRAFDWVTESQATERWKSERYDPNTITSLDLGSSVWDSPAIAHTLVSFGFADGRRLVFSAETRRKREQEFSTFGGFFKMFELVLIAAEESDALRLRSNIRKEELSLYPILATQQQMKELFLIYLKTGNELARAPAFYNTITANCTTVIFDLTHQIGSTLPYNWRVLVTGFLAQYLHENKLIRPDLPWPEVRRDALITQLGQSAAPGADYSAAVRSGPLFRSAK